MRKKKQRKPNKPYQLQPTSLKSERRILSLDPGTRNMGIACVGTSKGKIHVIANSILTNPITTLVADVRTQIKVYLEEIALWVELYKPDAIIMERFQTRGHGGPLIELVSMMIGVLFCEYKHLPLKVIAASTWKNAFHRRFTDELLLDEIYPQCLTTPHQLDASLIGCYGLELAMQRTLNYTQESIVAQVESTSALPLRRPK